MNVPRVDNTGEENRIYDPAADDFYEMIQIAIYLDLDTEADTLSEMNDFIRSHQVDFIDPLTPEDDLSNLVKRIDTEISDFLQNAKPVRSFSMCDMTALHQLSEIYNPHNLLALASTLLQSSAAGLSAEDADVLFRYRMTLQRIHESKSNLALNMIDGDEPRPTVGRRTWAGDIHPYACETGALILSEFFDVQPREDGTERTVVSGDEIVVIRNGHRLEE